MDFGARLKGVLTHAKDAGASMFLEKWLRQALLEYGELKQMEINSREKKVILDIHLKGEPAPVRLQIDNYEVITVAERPSIRILQASASRPWVQSLMRNFLVGKTIPVPREYEKYVGLVL